MARILSINDYALYADTIADMLRKRGGHEVQVMLTPLVMAEVRAFDPDLIIVNLVRKMESISSAGLVDFYAEVEGARAFQDLTAMHEPSDAPIILTSIAVLEREVPPDLRHGYMAFIEIPHKMDQLLHAVNQLMSAKEISSAIARE